MATLNGVQAPLSAIMEPKFTSDHQLVLLNSEEVRSRNREQLIEKLERVIQEKNASIAKLEERELHLEDILKKRNTEFCILEDQLHQYEEKTRTFEQLHQLQLQTFEKTIRDCQTENERLFEHANDLTRQLRDRSDSECVHQEKLLSFDRIAADTQLWREKLDSYKLTIENREDTIAELRKEIIELQKKKQTNGDFDENSLKVHIATLQNTLRDRDNEIEHLKLTLRHARNISEPAQSTHDSRWRSYNEDIEENLSTRKTTRSSSRKKRQPSPPVRDTSPSSPLDVEYLKTKIHTLTDRLTNVQQLLIKRDDQIATLKKVHDKRWLRLKHLQKQYRSVKDELQSYTDEELLQKNSPNDYFYGRAIRKNKTGCSICNDQRRRRQTGSNRKVLKHEDDDNVWNEITKLRRENGRLVNENVSLNEKIDLQEVEINEQRIVLGELRNEIQTLNNKDEKRHAKLPSTFINTHNDDQQCVIDELDKKLYDLETERTCLVFEQERLKTNLDLCIDEKQHLIQQRTQTTNDVKKLKLRLLALQDQIHKLKRTYLPSIQKNTITPSIMKRKRIIKKKANKSCLELLLEQSPSAAAVNNLPRESSNFYRVSSGKSEGSGTSRRRRQPRHRVCSLCDYHTEASLMKRRKRPSISSTIPKKKFGQIKKNGNNKVRRTNSSHHDSCSYYARRPVSISKTPTRIATMRRRIDQLQMDLTNTKEENEHLNQRLSTTLSRVNILKTSNQRLITECEKLKNDHRIQSIVPEPEHRRYNSASSDGGENIDNLYARLKNTSFDATRQRKLNKTLQTDNETLTKNLQSLTEKLTHSERDIASKRTLIENYKSRLTEIEVNGTPSTDRSTNEHDEERVKSLTETMEKLRVSLDTYKNRLQAITREKQTLETRHDQLHDEHQKLKIRYDEGQIKHRLNDQQVRQYRLNQDQLNQELLTSRRLSEQQILTLNSRNQDTLNRLTSELDRTRRRLDEYERFTNSLLHEMIRRSVQMNDSLRRAREHQKHRESLSMTLPGYDTAMNTASKILNLTQDDLDDIMSTADENSQAHSRNDNMDKNDKIRQKVSKLLSSQEDFANKLLKIFSKKLDEIQTTDRDLGMLRNT